MNDLVTCNKCGWVHFTVSKKYVENWKKTWKKYCKEWPEEKLRSYGILNRQPPSALPYYRCFLCRNSYKNFRPAKEGDCPDGCTINPILENK